MFLLKDRHRLLPEGLVRAESMTSACYSPRRRARSRRKSQCHGLLTYQNHADRHQKATRRISRCNNKALSGHLLRMGPRTSHMLWRSPNRSKGDRGSDRRRRTQGSGISLIFSKLCAGDVPWSCTSPALMNDQVRANLDSDLK